MQELVNHLATHLDDDLRLDTLSRRFSIPKYKLHREFLGFTGSTLGAFVERLRLERAADALIFHKGNVLQIAFECGYQNHETFSRAFHRRYGISPTEFRKAGQWRNQVNPPERTATGGPWQLSATRPQYLLPRRLICKRHVGRYENVPVDFWQEIAAYLESQDAQFDYCMGIGLDADEGLGEPLRFDAAICSEFDGELPPGLATGELSAGWYAHCTHVGPFDTLPEAYPIIYEQALALEDYQLTGLPVIEVYHGNLLAGDQIHQRTDVYLPMGKSGDEVPGTDVTTFAD